MAAQGALPSGQPNKKAGAGGFCLRPPLFVWQAGGPCGPTSRQTPPPPLRQDFPPRQREPCLPRPGFCRHIRRAAPDGRLPRVSRYRSKILPPDFPPLFSKAAARWKLSEHGNCRTPLLRRRTTAFGNCGGRLEVPHANPSPQHIRGKGRNCHKASKKSPDAPDFQGFFD